MSKKKVVVHDVPPLDDEDFEAWRYDDDLPVPDLRAPGGTMTQTKKQPRVGAVIAAVGGGGENRTRVRKRSTVRTTCLVASLCSRPDAAD